MRDTALAPGELQQQPTIGAQQGGTRAPAIAETRTAAVSPQAGRGRKTTTSAWIRTGTRGTALSTGGLQHQELIGEKHEGVPPPTTAATHPVAVPLSMGRGRQTTTLAWMRTGKGETAYTPGGLQHLSIGARQEENRTPAIVTIRPAGALPPVERGRWTTTPARMSTGTGGAVPATGGLQEQELIGEQHEGCLLYTSPSPRDKRQSRMPSSA